MIKRFLECFKNGISRLERFKNVLKFDDFDIKNEHVLWLLHKRKSLNCQFWETQKSEKFILLVIIYSDKTIFEVLQKWDFTTRTIQKSFEIWWFWYQKWVRSLTFARAQITKLPIFGDPKKRKKHTFGNYLQW